MKYWTRSPISLGYGVDGAVLVLSSSEAFSLRCASKCDTPLGFVEFMEKCGTNNDGVMRIEDARAALLDALSVIDEKMGLLNDVV